MCALKKGNQSFDFNIAHKDSSAKLYTMPDWTHLIRFIAVEDSLVHLGQLVDVTRDIGQESVDGVKIAAYVIEGTIFDGKVTKDVLHVKQVSVSPNFNGSGRLISLVAVSCLVGGL